MASLRLGVPPESALGRIPFRERLRDVERDHNHRCVVGLRGLAGCFQHGFCCSFCRLGLSQDLPGGGDSKLLAQAVPYAVGDQDDEFCRLLNFDAGQLRCVAGTQDLLSVLCTMPPRARDT